MASMERVTVTLPMDLVRDIDRREKNRSKFVAEVVRLRTPSSPSCGASSIPTEPPPRKR